MRAEIRPGTKNSGKLKNEPCWSPLEWEGTGSGGSKINSAEHKNFGRI